MEVGEWLDKAAWGRNKSAISLKFWTCEICDATAIPRIR